MNNVLQADSIVDKMHNDYTALWNWFWISRHALWATDI